MNPIISQTVLDAGRFDFEDGGTYCGGWEDGKAHGFGVCTGPKGMGEFSGAWEFGYEQSGIYLWPSGNCFQGEWMSGKRHGLGVEKKQRFIYKGEWSQGFKGRYGVRVSELSGAKYEGTWANGLQDGYGSETYADSGTYVGQMTQGMRNGYGIRTSVPYGTASRYRSKDVKDSLTSLRSEDDEERVQRERDRKFDENRGGFVLRAKSDINDDTLNQTGGIVSTALNGFFRRRRNSLGQSQERRISLRKTIMNKLTKQKSVNDLNDVTSHRSMTPAPTPSSRSVINPANANIKKSSFRSMSSNASVDSRTSNRTAPPGIGIAGLGSPGKAPLMDDGEHSFISQDEITDNNCIEVYMGEWKQDKRTGYGIAERADGLKYEGEWFNNKKNGYGVTTFKDGTKEEGKYKNNVLITDKKKAKLMLIRSSKQREKVDHAVNQALRAAQTAQQRAGIALGRAINARAKGHLAELSARQARANSEIARIKAHEVAPDFVQPGELKKHPEIQLDIDRVPLNQSQQGQLLLDPNNSISPQMYRRTATPSRPPYMNMNQRANQNSLSLDSATPYSTNQIQISPPYGNTSLSQQQQSPINQHQYNLMNNLPQSTPVKFQLSNDLAYNFSTQQQQQQQHQYHHTDLQHDQQNNQYVPSFMQQQQQQQQYFRQQNSFNYDDSNLVDPRLLNNQHPHLPPDLYLNGENLQTDPAEQSFQRNLPKRNTLKRAQRVIDASSDDVPISSLQQQQQQQQQERQGSHQREESSKRDVDIQPVDRTSLLPRRKSLPSIVKNQKFKEDEVAHSSSQLNSKQETFIIENGIRKRITETSNTSIVHNEDAINIAKFDRALDKASYIPNLNSNDDTSPKLPRKILIESITSLDKVQDSKTSAKRVSMPSIPAHLTSKYANKIMSREEANRLGSQRREELRNYAKLMETSSFARFRAAFPNDRLSMFFKQTVDSSMQTDELSFLAWILDMIKRHKVFLAIILFNISLAIWFLNLLK